MANRSPKARQIIENVTINTTVFHAEFQMGETVNSDHDGVPPVNAMM